MMMVVKEEKIGSSTTTTIVEDVEEGEISDDEVEEISAEDFKQQESATKAVAVAVTASSKPSSSSSSSSSINTDSSSRRGGWYQYSSNYGSGLHNFAWAQAVQNKPLSESLVREFELANGNGLANTTTTTTNRSTTTTTPTTMMTCSTKEVCNVIIDDDTSEEEENNKVEDEELEEGEIDLDSDMVEGCHNSNEKRISLIKETLKTVTVNDAEKSFDGVCLRLRTSVDSLQLIVSESGVSEVVYQAFTGIQAVISVFNSLNSKQQEQKKDDISRLLAHVKGRVPALFSPEQMKEVQAALDSLDSPSISSNMKDMEIEEVVVVTGVKSEFGILGEKPALVELGILGQKPGVGLVSSQKGLLEPISVNLGDQNKLTMGPENLKQGLFLASRGRGSFGPLLDLHGDHDVDSLPSPTREAPPPLYLRERKVSVDGSAKSESIPKVANKIENALVHLYETDALKAVSTYQQKFGRTSFLSNLPSPTPSEESDGGGGDCNGEVSSSSIVGKVRAVNPPVPLEAVGSVAPYMDKSTGHGLVPNKTMGQVASGQTLNVRASSKSRDPRLRLANPEVAPLDLSIRPLLRDTTKTEHAEGIVNLRKNKNGGEILVDGRALKKQKNGLTNWEGTRDVQMSRDGEWLESHSTAGTPFIDRIQAADYKGTDPRKSENGGIFSGQSQAATTTTSSTFNANTSGSEQLPLPAIGTSTTVSLPPLLKDIVVNPTMLMQLIMEQQRLAAEAQKSNNLLQGTTPAFPSSLPPGTAPMAHVAPSKSYIIEKQSVEKPRILSELTSTNPQGEWGKIRMKPRDPRRVLHSSTFQKNENLGSEQFKTNGAPTSVSQVSTDHLSVSQQSEQAQATSMPTQSAPPPDITWQFTKNLRNLADILSSQSTDSVSTVTQMDSSSQLATDSKDQHTSTVLTPEGVTETSRSQNTWGDVEHLFEGYDDQQIATIQRERARRIEEQNSMFAAKKLCLVLDLDHTLLNSAKFVEVEPVHEEILRKKEEQDREKPRRHLFRFSHMGMWTKLRPGIWTFLEKASKLFELHLYTMGNKLYATEMAKVLDPTGVLFAGRVISKGDEGDPFDGDEKLPKSKDLDGVLGMESAVVIIDDSVKVWPHNKLNLILVERYTYFPCSRRQFGLPGPSLLEIDHDERPEDGTLASSLGVIERIHLNFFSNPSLHEVDVRNILALEQRKILAGCRILFSRIFPVGEAKPHQHPLWLTAEQFGAVCTTQIDNLVTHVVANSLGTDKVNWALSTGRFVVHPGWVEASALLYRRANEKDFEVKINLP